MGYPERVEGEVGVYERWDAERHTDAFAAVCQDAEVMTFLGGPQPLSASADLSSRLDEQWAVYGFGLWACLDTEDRCVGFAGACRLAPRWDTQFPGEVEVGWRLARRVWGRGFATEAGRLAMAAGRDELGLDHVVSLIAAGNDRSRAVAHRLGMNVRERAAEDVDVFAVAL